MNLNIKYYFYLLVVILFAPWTYLIFKEDFLSGIISMVLSLLILLLLLNGYSKKTIIISLIGFFVFLASISLYSGNDKNIFTSTTSEVILLNQQRSFYPYGIGKFFVNTSTLQINKYEENFFDNLDLNLYFFAAHPRERVGVKEFDKYFSFMIFFFISGIISFIKGKKTSIVFILFIITGFVSGFLDKDYILGPILFFPLLNSILTIGMVSVITFSGKIIFKK